MSDELHEAARLGNVVEITRLITEDHIHPDTPHSQHQTPPLAWAAQTGQLEACKKLIELGANVNYQPHLTSSPLMVFALKSIQWKELFDYFITQGLKFDPNASAREGENKNATVLWYAACYKRWNFVKEILEKYPAADFNMGPEAKKTVLFHIAGESQWRLLLSILQKKKSDEINAKLMIASPTGSILGLALHHIYSNNSVLIQTQIAVINQILVRSILKLGRESTISSFAKIKQHLEVIANNVDERTTCRKHIRAIEDFSVFNARAHLDSNKLPLEIRLTIANYFVIAGLQEELADELSYFLFDIYKKETTNNNLVKVANSALSRWYSNHHNLFLEHALPKETKRDVRNCIVDCLSSKLRDVPNSTDGESYVSTLYSIEPTLRKGIIGNISNLPKDNLNRFGYEKAIDDAIEEGERVGLSI